MKERFEQREGITLIALVVTIIVLLILAGVSIAMLTGRNGILTQAQKAKEETKQAEKNEMSDLKNVESLINEYQNNIKIDQVTDEKPGELEQEDTNTLVINSIEDLVFFSNDVTNGNTYEGQTVKLGTNLDFNSDKSYVDANRTDFAGYSGPLKQALTLGTGFSPIGSGTNNFYGTFDGNNKAICSLYINIDSNQGISAGLFRTTYGIIKNLGIVNTDITVKAVYTGIGGIVGTSYNNIYNSYVTGNINVTGSSWMPVGGLCGVQQGGGTIENCYNLANINCENISVSGSANITCGGIVGQTQDVNIVLNKCFNMGNINANGNANRTIVGGICGAANSGNIIKNCYNNANVQGTIEGQPKMSIGGIVGSTNVNLANCYNIGNVIVSGKGGKYVGGITGDVWSNKTISNIYNFGNVIIEYCDENSSIGGISGQGYYSNNLNESYNIGKIEIKNGNSQKIGSIAGNDTFTFNKCYYLTGTYNVGVGGSNSSTEITEWDSIDKFPSVLDVVNGEGAFKEDVEGINNGYPILSWQ